ncbi:MAG: integrase [Rhizobacter sp.]|nr:integrase [Burkholderiales bacterium]
MFTPHPHAACWPVQDMRDIAYLLGQRPQDVYALTLDVNDEDLVSITQLKTGRKIQIENEGELTKVLARTRSRVSRPGVRILIVNEHGEAFTPGMFKKRFNKARKAAAVQFPLRDLSAKHATDTDASALAQKRLAHASRAITEHYVRQRLGGKVKPLNRKITGS